MSNAEQTTNQPAAPAATEPAAGSPMTPTGTALTVRTRALAADEANGIRLSELAARRVREYMEKNGNPDTMYLFIGVKGGGCSGLSYVLDLRDESRAPVAESDEVFESNGIVVVCDAKSYLVGNMTGTLIDYRDGLVGAGFSFHNPNAKRTCGCGSSYSA